MPRLDPELTPLPWDYRDLRRMLRRQGWEYEPDEDRWVRKDACGRTWITRLRKVDYGIHMDAHVLKNGKECIA